MSLTCYKKECNVFMCIDQPISHGIKKRLTYSPQPQVARFHPSEDIKEMFENRRQEAKQEAFIQHQRHACEDDERFLIRDNGCNRLVSPNIFRGLRYREWMPEVWESYKLYVQRMKEDSPDHPDPSLSGEKNDLLGRRITSTQATAVISPKVIWCPRVCMKDTLKAKTYLFTVTSSPRKNVKRFKTIKLPSYSRAFIQDARR